MWSMGVDTEPIFDEFILNLKSIDTDSHFDVLFKIIQDRLNRVLLDKEFTLRRRDLVVSNEKSKKTCHPM